MTAILGLLIFAVGTGIVLVAVAVGDIQWETRSQLTRCTTCGEHHHRHANHR
ncbi:hypothetical protein [Streptomyces sp. NPDC056132]|uniref:hypothetical protein n=1 Tax=Streptomyces sp. NPDC056132 TaxID=3345722 RepID=UPI0035D543E3